MFLFYVPGSDSYCIHLVEFPPFSIRETTFMTSNTLLLEDTPFFRREAQFDTKGVSVLLKFGAYSHIRTRAHTHTHTQTQTHTNKAKTKTHKKIYGFDTLQTINHKFDGNDTLLTVKLKFNEN